MKVTITSLGGRAPPVRTTPTPCAGFRPLQIDVFTLEPLELLAFGLGQARTEMRIPRGLAHPPPQALGREQRSFTTDRIVAHC
jgi:hypothetical protein